MKLSRAEIGMLGHLASLKTQQDALAERVQKYLSNPTLCLKCNNALPYKKRWNKFCSRSCAASINNAGVVRNGTPLLESKCANCNNDIPGSRAKYRKYCSRNCQTIGKFLQQVRLGLAKGPSWKNHLIRTRGYSCAKCGLDKWNDLPISLELEHKDGNHENNTEENLCLLCPNCHSQTPTYKAKNKGNGRHYRTQRRKEGKSF